MDTVPSQDLFTQRAIVLLVGAVAIVGIIVAAVLVYQGKAVPTELWVIITAAPTALISSLASLRGQAQSTNPVDPPQPPAG